MKERAPADAGAPSKRKWFGMVGEAIMDGGPIETGMRYD